MQIKFVIPNIASQENIHAQFTEMLQCFKDIDLEVDMDGFAMTWAAENTRVAVLCFGRRWYDTETSGSLILIEGAARRELIRYIRDACGILGVHSIYMQKEPGDDYEGEEVTMLKMKA